MDRRADACHCRETGVIPERGRDEIDASIERWSKALAAYQRNARTASVWADASWLAGYAGCESGDDGQVCVSLSEVASTLDERCVAAVSLALLRSLDIGVPALNTLVGPHWSALDAVPGEVAARILRTRSLIFRRMEVRRLIDRQSRAKLYEWTGMQIDLFSNPDSNAPDIASLARTAMIPPLRELDAKALSGEGLALLMRDLDVDRPPFTLQRLLFARNIGLPAWPGEVDRALDYEGSIRLMAGLPEWLPEWGWVFG
ncbi:type III secretion protein HrpB4 [Burkholderia pyrrocinia]|uniref:type III secretion protein HrpB4 n=1 Tax=Burkholderia pyrrocinia TaxID=60550 RepID=UPI00158EE619|nr:type III secretion protein HrpB4 [Burkholderia pyrrocinia]